MAKLLYWTYWPGITSFGDHTALIITRLHEKEKAIIDDK
jgi:hypothetical protein